MRNIINGRLLSAATVYLRPQTPMVEIKTSSSPTRYQTALLYLAGVRILVHRLWVRVFGSAEPPPIAWREVRLLCLGLDGAGKSSLIKRAGDMSAAKGIDSSITPTNGFGVHTCTVKPDWKCELWEVGGAAAVRQFWMRYATPDTHGLLWVVDGTDSKRLGESAQCLKELLTECKLLRSRPLLVLVSKADIGGGLSEEAAAEGMALTALAARGLHIGPRKVRVASAFDGRGVAEGLRWLCDGEEVV